MEGAEKLLNVLKFKNFSVSSVFSVAKVLTLRGGAQGGKGPLTGCAGKGEDPERIASDMFLLQKDKG